MTWRGEHLLVNAVIGAVAVVVYSLGAAFVDRAGAEGPWLLLPAVVLFSAAGFCCGWWRPGGLPGTCLGVLAAVYVPAVFQGDAMSKALTFFAALAAAGVTGVAELIGAVLAYRRWLREPGPRP